MAKRRSDRLSEALRIRDAALCILRREGRLITTNLPGKVLEANTASLAMLHRTPFQRLPELSARDMYDMAMIERATGKPAKRNLPYGLDVWAGRKVLNIEWSMNDQVGVIDSHALEVMRDSDGGWYASHCGWGQGGVFLAPLEWKGDVLRQSALGALRR